MTLAPPAEPLPVETPDPQLLLEEPVLPGVYARFPTKHVVPQGFFPEEQVRAAGFHPLTDAQRRPVPGITVASKFTDWDRTLMAPRADAAHKQRVAAFKEKERIAEQKIVEAIERNDLKQAVELIDQDDKDLPEHLRAVL